MKIVKATEKFTRSKRERIDKEIIEAEVICKRDLKAFVLLVTLEVKRMTILLVFLFKWVIKGWCNVFEMLMS